MMNDNDIQNINELIKLTYEKYNINLGNIKYADCILNIFKEYHYYPLLKVKKFKNNDNLVLIHNSYKKDNIDHFKQLYDECRSVVLDFSAINNVVITYANSIPERVKNNDYLNHLYNINDKCYVALDGTMITVYNYNNEWYFGTTSCPNVNSSIFSHPTKKHGDMLNEVLYNIFKVNNEKILRELFTNNLNPLYSYEFVLVHHENKHIIDYTNELGENYKFLFHINTKNRITLCEESIEDHPLENIGILYSYLFESIDKALLHLNTHENCYGIIIKNNNKIYKISNDKILHQEEYDPCNYNIWYNLLYVYMLNRPDYKIANYINTYGKNKYIKIYDNLNNEIDPTYLIHTVISTIKDVLYNLYITTTKYYPKYNRFKANMDLDKSFDSLIRFHLAQLRHLQIILYKKHILVQKNILYYLCHINNINNIKNIIKYFTINNKFNIPDDKLYLFSLLDNLLSL